MPESPTSLARLNSWKEIASYLQKDIRTAVRWEKQHGLPVHRVPGGARQSVFAYPQEIEDWLKGQKGEGVLAEASLQPNAPSAPASQQAGGIHEPTVPAAPIKSIRPLVFRLLLICLGLILAFSCVALKYHSAFGNPKQPAQATFTPDSVQAWDDHHHLLWEHRFPQSFATVESIGAPAPDIDHRIGVRNTNRAFLYDLFGDGQREVLTITLFQNSDSAEGEYRQMLSCFSSSGKLLWNYEPETVLMFGGEKYGAPWKLLDPVISNEPGRKTIWIIVSSYQWGKSFVARIDADGHAIVQFVSSGEMATLQRFHGPLGPMLWIGGFNDEYDTASLAILHDMQGYAVSPQTPGSVYACQNCGQGDPYAYFVFPRYELSRKLYVPNNKVYAMFPSSNGVEVRQAELSINDQLLYDFSNDSNPRPLRVRYSASFWPNHLELERSGKISHPLNKCPDRLHPPPVRTFEHEKWSEIAVSASSPL